MCLEDALKKRVVWVWRTVFSPYAGLSDSILRVAEVALKASDFAAEQTQAVSLSLLRCGRIKVARADADSKKGLFFKGIFDCLVEAASGDSAAIQSGIAP